MTRKVLGIIIVIILIAFIKACSLSGTTKVKGFVVEVLKVRTGRNNAKMDLPIVRFDYEGTTYQTKRDLGVTFVSNFSIGDSAYAYFPQGHPSASEVYTFSGYWLSFPTVSITLLLCIAWLGISNIISMSSKNEN